MTQNNSSLVWWSYFIFTQILLVTSNLSSSSGKKPDREEVILEMISFDHRYNDMSRPTEKRFLKYFYLGRTNRRSRGLAPENHTLGLKNQTMKFSKAVELGDNTDKERPLQPLEPTFPPVNPTESCSNRCSNRTYFASSISETVPRCQCDSSCNDIFTDCCSNYTQHCSSNVKPVESRDPVYLARSYFRCVTQLKYSISFCFVPPGGVWMISRCPEEWSNDFLRDKCHEPSSTPQNGTYDSFAPVFSRANQLTYRNQYCALCHNVVDYELWSLVFRGPDKNVTKLTTFLAQHGQLFLGVKPIDYRPLRYCFFPSVVKTCPVGMTKSAHERCVNGSVEIVRWVSGMKYYKNRACALCHGVTSPSVVQQMDSCFEGTKPISHAVDLNSYGVTLRTAICPRNQVFDPYLGACRRSYQPLPVRNGSQDAYRVVMSLLPTTGTASIAKSFLMDDLANNFNLNRSQITDVKLFGKVLGFVIAFTLRITPLQSVIFASNSLDVNGTKTFGLRKLFRFKDPFDLTLFNKTNFTVYHLITHRLTCIHRRAYSSEEFVVLCGQRIFVNSTGVTYRLNEYDLNKSNFTSATVCLKLAPSQCNASYISLVPSEYHLLSNLTLVYRSSKHDFGDYTYINGTVVICVDYKRIHHIYTSKTHNDLALTVLNLVGFICSVVCLLILIVTYSIFKELRTLPGKNLMSLAVSLAFAELFWLCGGFVSSLNEGLCTAFALANHYFFLVYFTASSVIAFHTCSVFGRSMPPRRSQEENIKIFRVYSVVTWGIPVLFVLTFYLLDHYEMFLVNYGSDDFCWLGTTQSKVYLFILPFGILLLFNLILFVFVAVSIRKSNRKIVANDAQPASRNMANLVICMKLSTLMGFSWLFVLLYIVAGSETEAFVYLFVIFVSLEGIFVSGAFLFNRKCFELYRRLVPRKPEIITCNSSAQNYQRQGNNFTQETKL